MEENTQMKDAQKALMDLALDSAKENKLHAKRWFTAFLISNAIWASVVIVIVLSFLWFESQFEYETTETTETTVYQDTGEGSGNNVYQAGEHATYNEGGELNGEAGDQNQDYEENDENEDVE